MGRMGRDVLAELKAAVTPVEKERRVEREDTPTPQETITGKFERAELPTCTSTQRYNQSF